MGGDGYTTMLAPAKMSRDRTHAIQLKIGQCVEVQLIEEAKPTCPTMFSSAIHLEIKQLPTQCAPPWRAGKSAVGLLRAMRRPDSPGPVRWSEQLVKAGFSCLSSPPARTAHRRSCERWKERLTGRSPSSHSVLKTCSPLRISGISSSPFIGWTPSRRLWNGMHRNLRTQCSDC